MKSLLLVAFALTLGCNSNQGLHQIEWREGDSATSLQALKKVEVSNLSRLQSSVELVELQQQTFHGIPIEDSFVKKLSRINGEPLMVRAAVSLADSKLQNLVISDFADKGKTILGELKIAFPSFRQRPPEKIEVRIIHHHSYYEPVWNITYTDKNRIPWEMKVGSHLQIRSIRKLGSQFHDVPAFVFPRGPKNSSLQEVTLKGLAANPTLANDNLVVTSQADLKIEDLTQALKFPVSDVRFDQVQAFYYLNESLTWFSKTLNVKLPFTLQAEVGSGFPEKTNSAFYYQGKIRFGSGDDQVYSHIPQDPTIVIHESVHAIIDAIARLSYEGEGGSLNEAFADFFTSVQLDNPNMGESAYLKGPFRRSLINNLKLIDKNGGLYHDSGIISATLWDLRLQFGLEKARSLGLLTLNRLSPSSDFDDFRVQLKDSIPRVLSSEEQILALSLIGKRGF